ncbi:MULTISPECIES: sigma-70 family RNA polymerase sigma factor [Sulfitobacter]|jgi:RNA polymerase sigma-32 factor|nr:MULTISPECIES: sigma-70 family RNA polymerase sigma factor [Sulfitobacter]MAN09993.1 RNA polymerase subunit sigma-70 [Roseobacter sp.]NKX47587.1 sigma-70 family RNA polymerase sigma factor [Rhodobacteraceae bacterium R_SAG8]AXI52629.1 RNA polymerase subunit sigma-70 [Sulfitobacter sp. SK025]EAP79646.1 RNA polymerase sigma-32 factor [Sulfitobacter sp. NAS-14.1]EAP82904.1 RNA polymerase sigma-32 factor [Sulfitobacter sp. EE-36]
MTITYAAARNAPMLALEDERVLLKDWQVSKDKFALESLVLSHARIVFYWARKLSDDQAEREDLISEGILGLIHAADLFDLDRDVRFSTYAKWWVKNATMTARNHLRAIVETPAGVQKTVQHSIDDDDSFALLASEDPNPEEAVIAQSSQTLIRARLLEAMERLQPMDREVLRARTLQQPPESIQDLATRMEVTPAKLRQIERRAMSRLKYELAARGVMTSKMH